MQEVFCYFIGIVAAFGMTMLVAFPDRLLPSSGGRKKKFSATHWGAYDGVPAPEDDSEEVVIEVGVPAKKIRHVVGSQTYAGGRGVSMRGG